MVFRKQRHVAALVGLASFVTGLTREERAFAAPPEPSGAHPRLWLDAKTKQSLKALAAKDGSAVARAIRECRRAAAEKKEEARNAYMGFNWASNTSTCALAYHATGNEEFAKTGLYYWTALLDDWDTIGDGKGGDTAVRHDSGYAIRAVGVHAAIGYDLLHDAPGMTPALLQKARTRFAAWNDWYYANGYRAKSPGTNYQAGYLFAVTAMAIAQGSEGGAQSAKLWKHVADEIWGNQMKRAAAPGGLLDGGDWGEGWQYAPLSVASYALSARAMIDHGLALPEFQRWTDDVVVRHVHALTPGDKGIFVAGDTQSETPSITPNAWTLDGVIAGPSSEKSAAWARAELNRLKPKTDDKTFLFFDVLAEARGVAATPFPRDSAATFYIAKGTGALYARTSWSPSAVWMAMQCTRTIDVDHLPANAGNFVLSRGADELIVDPSPYGSLSSLTSNAPTVESAQLPADYKPSQAFWSEKTRYAWARQTESAVVAARCDYADQYKFQERPSDVPFAVRDLVLVPSSESSATLVVVDRAKTGADARGMYLRFRSPVGVVLGKDGRADGSDGRSALTIAPAYTSSGAPTVQQTSRGDCFGRGTTRGNCKAARFPVTDYEVILKGGAPLAIHLVDVSPARDKVANAQSWSAPDHRAVSFERGKKRGVVVVGEPAAANAASMTYRAEPGHHVVLDAPGSGGGAGRVQVSTQKDGTACKVTLKPAREGGFDARPLVMNVSDACEAKEDATSSRAAFASAGGSGGGAPAGAGTGGGAPAVDTGEPRPKTGEEVFVPPPISSSPAPVRSGACACETVTTNSKALPGAALLGVSALAALRLRRRTRARAR